jgi:hypothetical protein
MNYRLYIGFIYVLSFLVMLASSWIDGTYLSKLTSWAFAGYILNFVCDGGSLLLSRIYSEVRLHEIKTSKRYKLARGLLWFELAAVAYSWLFSYRQLRPLVWAVETRPVILELLPKTKNAAWAIEAFTLVIAGFVPVLLAGFGYAQAVLSEKDTATEPETQAQPERSAATAPETEPQRPETEPQPDELPEYAVETVAYFAHNPGATYTEAAAALDCSPRTVSNHMKRAETAGVAHRNGDGWEVHRER